MCTKRQQRRRCDTRRLSRAGRVSALVSRHRTPQATGKCAQYGCCSYTVIFNDVIVSFRVHPLPTHRSRDGCRG